VSCARLYVGAEDGVEGPLLEYQFGNAEVHRFRIVVHDIGVFGRLGEHQVFEIVLGNAIEGEIAQLLGVSTLHQFVVNQLADECRVDDGQVAGDDAVLNRLGHVDGHLDGEVGLVEDLLDDPLTIPREIDVVGAGLNEQEARVGYIDVGVVAAAAYTNFAAGHIALLSIALIGGHHECFSELGQNDFRKVLNIFNLGDPFPVVIGVDIKFALGSVELLQYLIGYLRGKAFILGFLLLAGNGFHGAVNRQLDFLPAKRNNESRTLLETVEGGVDMHFIP